MKKNIKKQQSLMTKFEKSQISGLLTILGGVESEKTTTYGYSTHSSATDQDAGEHDAD